jgi:ribosomal protein L11 methyltransferase
VAVVELLTLRAPSGEIELALDHLLQHGAQAVIEEPGDDYTVLVTDLGDVSACVADGATRGWVFGERVVDVAVMDGWRTHAEPTVIDDALVIVPAWWVPPSPDGTHDLANSTPTVVPIEPGPTFGLGDHPTTVLALRSLRRLDIVDRSVLDVGCGSGVLAISALVLGAGAATAIDIMPAVVDVARANAERNAVGDRLAVSTTTLADVEGSFDIVLANILAPVLVELAEALADSVAPGGHLVVTGLLETRYQHVVEALEPLRTVHLEFLEGWVAVTLRREAAR